MPIQASLPVLQSQLIQAFSMDKGASIPISAQMIGSAVGSIVPTGIFPPFPPAPLVPAGLPAGISLLQQAMSLDKGANKATVSKMIAQAVSLIAPMAPPAGLSVLANQIEIAFSMDKGAQKQPVASQIATAIITYYTMGGVL